jgi:hypothetical protein
MENIVKEEKVKLKMSWLIVKFILLSVKVFFSKVGMFIVNFFVFLLPVAMNLNFSLNLESFYFFIACFIVYPFFFELMYIFFLRNKINEAHKLIDEVVCMINNNFEEPKNNS